jgi:hypothetical protein
LKDFYFLKNNLYLFIKITRRVRGHLVETLCGLLYFEVEQQQRAPTMLRVLIDRLAAM